MKRPSDIPERIWHISLGMGLERDPGEEAEPFIMRVLTRLRVIEEQQGQRPSTGSHGFTVKHDGTAQQQVDYYLSEDGNLFKEVWSVTPKGETENDVSFTLTEAPWIRPLVDAKTTYMASLPADGKETPGGDV